MTLGQARHAIMPKSVAGSISDREKVFLWNKFSSLHFCVLASLLVSGAIYAATIRGGQLWTEDFAVYIRHGMNIAEGLSYNHLGVPDLLTGRVFSYPVGLPVIIAGVYSLFGFSLYAFQWIIILSLLMFLVVFILLANRFRAPSYLAIFLFAILISANPDVWQITQQINSDLPFIFFTFLALYLYEAHCSPLRYQTPGSPSGGRLPARSVAYMAALSLAIIAAYSVRTVGLVVPISIIAYEIVRFRKLHFGTLLILLPFFVFMLVQDLLIGSLASYAQEVTTYLDPYGDSASSKLGLLDPRRIIGRALGPFRWTLMNFFETEASPVLDLVIAYGLVGGLAAIGYVSRLFRNFSIIEVFGPVYFATFVVSHVPAYERYLLPLFALVLLYAIEGIVVLARRLKVPAHWATYGFAAILLSAYALEFTTHDKQDPGAGIARPSAQELYAWIKNNTDKDDILAAQKAKAITLMTWRRVGSFDRCSERKGCHFLVQSDRIWRYLESLKVKYLVLMTADASIDSYRPDKLVIEGIVEPHRENFRLAFKNDEFEILEILRYTVP